MEEDQQKPKRLSKQEKKELKYQRLKEKYKKKRENKETKRSRRKAVPLDQLPPKHHIAIEVVGGKSLMTDKEMRSLAQQIRYSYAANRISKNPVNFLVGNFSLIKEFFPDEYVNWKNISFMDSSACALNDGSIGAPIQNISSVVVLSADAEETLETIDENTLYVIGGLVDRNRHKGYIEEMFKDKFRTAKLPITKTLSSSTVLSSLHVFSILLDYIETKNWEHAIEKHIPERKQKVSSNGPLEQDTPGA
ncbi:tRNA (guanine9-N1)-methyltransferase [Nematocida sp. LUAm3]|nr:tRNA (guanine9-N1)-methyltransferase [Nematocida sp. LUAm3]KAI5174880.1 tRNA (guanine9-N1)-methyltransferase [Nematocida sp. LUAm2]KAI5177522.1 tRNA (guanine9-N1)-methyltransferase [Nematocida sp. LUAm1]